MEPKEHRQQQAATGAVMVVKIYLLPGPVTFWSVYMCALAIKFPIRKEFAPSPKKKGESPRNHDCEMIYTAD